MAMTVDAFAEGYIKRWEGGLSVDPNDNGNWFLFGAPAQKRGQGVLVGSKYGVTGATLAQFRGVRTVTAADIASLTMAEAVAVAKRLFFLDVGLDRLVWNRVTASVLDFGWGAGPVRSIKLLQDLLDQDQDGKIGVGGATATAFATIVAARGEVFLAGAWWALREEYYEDLVVRRPTDGIYLKGWDNRSAYFTPGHAESWWTRFAI